eukprot:6123292-Prymnesium_polylepis.2
MAEARTQRKQTAPAAESTQLHRPTLRGCALTCPCARETQPSSAPQPQPTEPPPSRARPASFAPTLCALAVLRRLPVSDRASDPPCLVAARAVVGGSRRRAIDHAPYPFTPECRASRSSQAENRPLSTRWAAGLAGPATRPRLAGGCVPRLPHRAAHGSHCQHARFRMGYTCASWSSPHARAAHTGGERQGGERRT